MLRESQQGRLWTGGVRTCSTGSTRPGRTGGIEVRFRGLRSTLTCACLSVVLVALVLAQHLLRQLLLAHAVLQLLLLLLLLEQLLLLLL